MMMRDDACGWMATSQSPWLGEPWMRERGRERKKEKTKRLEGRRPSVPEAGDDVRRRSVYAAHVTLPLLFRFASSSTFFDSFFS